MEYSLMKEEWIDGIVMMSPRPEYNHMKIMKSLGIALENYFKNKCEVAIENALFLTKDNPKELKNDLVRLKALITAKKAELSPDIAVYCDKSQIFRRGFLGIPQIIVEVLSPSNSTDDTEVKKQIYENFGVLEYWIVDPQMKQVFIHVIDGSKYELKGTYNFIEEEIKSIKFDNLVVDIKDIELV